MKISRRELFRFIGLGSLAAGATFLTRRIGAGVAAIQAAREAAEAKKMADAMVSWNETPAEFTDREHTHSCDHTHDLSELSYSYSATATDYGSITLVAGEPPASPSLLVMDESGNIHRVP